MKNIINEVFANSPRYLREASGRYSSYPELRIQKHFDVSPIVKIISDYFIWDNIERMLREPPRPIIFKKDLSNLKNTII